MSNPKKNRSQKQSLDSASCKGESPPKTSPIAEMTSREYQRLNRGEPDDKKIKSYIGLKDATPLKEIRDQQIKSMAESDAMGFRQAMDRSAQIHHDLVWEARRKLAAEMNQATLQSLASYYGIPLYAELIRDHPDANDLDKGLILARLSQFLEWDGEYHGTALEMRDIDVEATIEAAKTRTKGPQPSDTEPLESVLRHASTCKDANNSMLLQALKDCIAVKCVSPALEKNLTLRIETTTANIADMGDTEDHGDLTEAEASTVAPKETLGEHEKELQGIRSYIHDFAPGKAMPQIVKEKTDKWFKSQFIAGKPVASKVRLAWLLGFFHSFWTEHRRGYLAMDPSQRAIQTKASAHGKDGAATKVDAKWRKRTTQFVEYITREGGRSNMPSTEGIHALINGFCDDLIDKKEPGASDKRTVAGIREFLSTLGIAMNRKSDRAGVRSIWEALRKGGADRKKGKVSSQSSFDESPTRAKQGNRSSAGEIKPSADDISTHADKRRRSNKGEFRRSAFSSLHFETFEACLEILRGAFQHRNAPFGAERRPKKGR